MLPRPRSRRAAAVVLIAFSVVAAGLRAAAETADRPNIVLIFADDLV